VSVSKILIVDDDRPIRESLERALTLAGHEVALAVDGEEALKEVANGKPDLIMLDWMMPKMDGITVIETLRADGVRTPILFLTAKSDIADRVDGLDAGADDFVSKPVALEELLARVRALLRRPIIEAESPSTLEVAGISVDLRARLVAYGGKEVALTKTEFDLLALLFSNKGTVLTTKQIYEQVWGYDFGPGSKNLAVYVSYLRRKFEQIGAPDVITAIRGVGYGIRQT
jgi:two-component system, OmpR family, response regulator MprA